MTTSRPFIQSTRFRRILWESVHPSERGTAHRIMTPEIILDRFVRENFPNSYSGKLDIERIGSPSLRTLLYGLQIETNDALRLENANASGGVVHPPFHFDYLNATVTNAHAIP